MIAIIDYGMGNLRSVQKAFEYVGYQAVVTQDSQMILNASHVVLPGVGAFGGAIRNLEIAGLIDTIYRVVEDGRPFLGICLGLQLLFERSYEGGLFKGLGLLPGEVKRLPEELNIKIPHMGWNELKHRVSPIFEGLNDPCFVYFVHSYYVEPRVSEHVIGTTFYGIDITVAVNKDNVYGFQFHPEKSGAEGLKMLRNFARLK
ncbi:glutamine amidotransferase [Caldicoprobacter guelmensis]|uniref:imidazole glycerol phosphate synthase subunit HisH n=1 Tax=Caldicoprobacter guelmensis TaxID=1170224 RepID=UPI0019578A0A|nr:imidazole glycerol phosphate synthase subunit HisH [Caldicoprobacter guelmensis]MBM7583128.1 glutamine amidotransferase [Caldicoprobacter guelmensis]